MEKTLYTIIVHSENIAGLLNQVTAVFTRRQINIESLNVSASSIQGVHKYTITAWTDAETIEKVVKQIEKKIDVLQANYFVDDEIYQHEIALYKLSTPEFQSNPMASKVIRRHNARIVEVNPVYSIVIKIWAIKDEVVVLPWEPATQILFLNLSNSASISLRCPMGSPISLAACNSKLSE